MKTTIFTLFYLSSVCFFPLFENNDFPSSTSVSQPQFQDTTTIEYWKQEAKKWEEMAKENMYFAQQNAEEAMRRYEAAEEFRELAKKTPRKLLIT